MNTELMFSSATDKWDTPADLVADLATVFDWDLSCLAKSTKRSGKSWQATVGAWKTENFKVGGIVLVSSLC